MPLSETVAIQLTGAGMGAIGVVLVCGGRAGETIAAVSGSPRGAKLLAGETALVKIRAAAQEGGEAGVVDEALLVRTGEERFELHVHGGVAVMEAALRAFKVAGARVIGIEEAAAMGILGDQIEAEMIAALARAKTATAARVLLAQPAAWKQWGDRWEEILAAGPADALWRFQAQVQWVMERSRSLARLLDPARVALIGAPNVGKSTLANALLGRRISITSDQAGTTRDWVDAEAIFVAGSGEKRAEVPVVLVDTAGVRETADALETESIARSHAQAAEADVVVVLCDATRQPAPEEQSRAEHFPARAVVAVNKMDAAVGLPRALHALHPVTLSAKKGSGLDALMEAVLARLDLLAVSPGEPFAFNARLRSVLERLSLARDVRMCRDVIGMLLHHKAPPEAAG